MSAVNIYDIFDFGSMYRKRGLNYYMLGKSASMDRESAQNAFEKIE